MIHVWLRLSKDGRNSQNHSSRWISEFLTTEVFLWGTSPVFSGKWFLLSFFVFFYIRLFAYQKVTQARRTDSLYIDPRSGLIHECQPEFYQASSIPLICSGICIGWLNNRCSYLPGRFLTFVVSPPAQKHVFKNGIILLCSKNKSTLFAGNQTCFVRYYCCRFYAKNFWKSLLKQEKFLLKKVKKHVIMASVAIAARSTAG